MGIDLYEGSEWKAFTEHLTYVADEAINRVFKGSKFIPLSQLRFRKAVKHIHKSILKVVQDRQRLLNSKAKDPETYDLLDVMLTAPLYTDSTGRGVTMSNELIRANLTTILSAGHSTTTSMLSWTCNFLFDSSLGNSDYRYQLIQEVSQLAGEDGSYKPAVEDVYKRLGFMTNVLKESLRLVPPIPTIIRHCLSTCSLGGYGIKRGETVMISTVGTHLNAKSWSDPETFDPFRFDNPPPLPCSFIPWAGGARQCIGREFALLTGRLGLFLILNQYTLELSPEARVREDEHLFVFPEGLLMNIIRRKTHRKLATSSSTSSLPVTVSESSEQVQSAIAWDGLKALVRESGHKVHIAISTKTEGGNTSTVSQALLQKALDFNFQTGNSPLPVDDILPTWTTPPEQLPFFGLCTSTYQGKPPPNGKKAAAWLQDMLDRLQQGQIHLADHLKNVRYFVFGCGNRNWSTTYQKIAIFFDEGLAKLGAKRICPLGTFDESKDDLEEQIAAFFKVMGPALMHSLPEIGDKRLRAVDASSIAEKPSIQAQVASSAHSMTIVGDTETGESPAFLPSIVEKPIFRCPISKILDITPNAEKATLHIEFQMQPGMEYRAGDHLVVCPVIPEEDVERIMRLFVDYDTTTVVQWSSFIKQNKGMNRFHLPLDRPMTVGNILSNLVDIKAIPTKQFIANYATIVSNPEHAKKLQTIAGDGMQFKEWLKSSTHSVIDVIEEFPPRDDRFDRLLEILPVLKPRPYSISSSPKLDSTTVHLCVGVVEDRFPGGKSYKGTCSYYLKTMMERPVEERFANVFFERADESFAVPQDNSLPIILISAGTGFAPMRGFLQGEYTQHDFSFTNKLSERKARNSSGEAFVFFGCRSEDTDWLFVEEQKQYKAEGFITDMFVGFSRSKVYPSSYVQAKIAEQAEPLWNSIHEKGAFIYICGSGSRVGAGTRQALLDIIQNQGSRSQEEAEEYLSRLEVSGRYQQDVWG